MTDRHNEAARERFYYKKTNSGDFVVGDNETTPSNSFAGDDPMRGLMRPVYFDDEGHARIHCRFLNFQQAKPKELRAFPEVPKDLEAAVREVFKNRPYDKKTTETTDLGNHYKYYSEICPALIKDITEAIAPLLRKLTIQVEEDHD